MPSRSVVIEGTTWHVYPSGFVTQSDHDEFGLLFVRAGDASHDVRTTRYSPQGVSSREQSFAALSDAQLLGYFAASQPSATAPETGYHA